MRENADRIVSPPLENCRFLGVLFWYRHQPQWLQGTGAHALLRGQNRVRGSQADSTKQGTPRGDPTIGQAGAGRGKRWSLEDDRWF